MARLGLNQFDDSECSAEVIYSSSDQDSDSRVDEDTAGRDRGGVKNNMQSQNIKG